MKTETIELRNFNLGDRFNWGCCDDYASNVDREIEFTIDGEYYAAIIDCQIDYIYTNPYEEYIEKSISEVHVYISEIFYQDPDKECEFTFEQLKEIEAEIEEFIISS